MKAKSRIPPDRMNKTEKRFAAELWAREREGKIIKWEYEALRLILGHACSYTPDFYVLDPQGNICFYEVKGFWRDDARVKIKTAARKFPEFTFVAVSWSKQAGWQYEEIKP